MIGSVQYGQYAGARVTYITRSGDSEFHGDGILMWNPNCGFATSFTG